MEKPIISADVIFRYFPSLGHIQKQQFSALFEVYSAMNTNINLIAAKDIQYLYIRHVLHALSIIKIWGNDKPTTLIDIGTGGGFPGIPLAIMFPDTHFYLVDSKKKKIHVLKNIIQQIKLNNISLISERIEDINISCPTITARAVAPAKALLKWCAHCLKAGPTNSLSGLWMYKGGDIEAEMKECRRKYKQYYLTDYFTIDYFKEKYIIHVPI